MAEFSVENALLRSHFSIFNGLVRSKGESFLESVRLEIGQLVAAGARRSDATRSVIESRLREHGALDQLQEQVASEFKKLVTMAGVGVFQERLAFRADEDGVFVWVAVLSSATCAFTPRSASYQFLGRPMRPEDFCRDRHGMQGDSEFWDRMGRPRTGKTACISSCECALVPGSFWRANPGLREPVDLS